MVKDDMGKLSDRNLFPFRPGILTRGVGKEFLGEECGSCQAGGQFVKLSLQISLNSQSRNTAEPPLPALLAAQLWGTHLELRFRQNHRSLAG